MEKHCVGCHGAEKRKGNVALHEYRDELSVLRGRRQWKDVLEMVRSGDMPPDDEPQPGAQERRDFIESITALFANADNAKPDPGRATVRRLNRTEYNNTIRDLLRVEFRPADDFPSDEVGHGFDNIADVLSVSPVLMERYLDAASKVAELAIPLDPAKPPKRTLIARYLEPASPETPLDKFRPVSASRPEHVFSGPLNTPVRILPGGEHVMRVKLYAKPASSAPVKIALLVSGAKIEKRSADSEMAALDGAWARFIKPCLVLKTVDITARTEADAQLIEARIPVIAGIERIAVASIKPPPGQPAPTLFVEWMECEGPLDARSTATKSLMIFTPGKPQSEQTRELLYRFVSRAWRRPVQTEELDRLCQMVDYAVGHGDNWEQALRKAVTAVLASPKFIFRLEPDDQPANPEPHAIDQFQLATRLSYFLWSTCPDEELLHLAWTRQLTANLETQVGRMLKDPRSDALVENFAIQWLQLGRLAGHSADEKTFPRWKPELRASMLEETRRFVGEIFRSDRSVLDLLDADFTWVDRRLAELYDVVPAGGVQENEWKRVSLAGSARGGLLTQASVLTVTSNPTRTSPVKRGKWVLEQLLGNPPPPAPPNVPSLDDKQRKELSGSFRQKLEQHRADPKCAGCHAKMDAFGFALESFDGIGQWRDRDENGAPVDASSKLAGGKKINGITDLKAFLRERRQDFARCLTEKMLIYALGRGLDYYDQPSIERIQTALARDGYKTSVLISQIVKSDPFLLRRGKVAEITELAGDHAPDTGRSIP